MSRCRPAVVVVPAAVAALLAAGCSSAAGPTALPAGSGPAGTVAPTTVALTTAAPTPASSTGTRRSPVRWLGATAAGPAAPVQAATRAYWSMVVRLAERPDPADPELVALTVSPQRESLVTVYTNIEQQGIAQRGPIDGTVTVDAVAAGSATARTCLDQTLVRVYDRAGKVRPGSTGSLTLFTVRLRRDAGAWKVAEVTGRDGACTIPR